MPEPATHHARHSITVQASAETVYSLIADVEKWPYVFPPTIQAERLEHDAGSERIRLCALANDEVKTWTSRRELDRDTLTVRFRQDVSQPPVAAMGGTWTIEPRGEKALVVLDHDFQALDDDPRNVRWIEQAVDRNSLAELGRLKGAAELPGGVDQLTLTFADQVRIRGRRDDVYAFLYEAGVWPRRLPHVARLELREDVPNVQEMEMDTKAADGSTHTTRSVRICTPGSRIAYKQIEPPAAMAGHTGEWLLETAGDGDTVIATSWHTVLVDPEAAAKIVGEENTVGRAKEMIHAALSKNSTTTLEHARAFAEERRRD